LCKLREGASRLDRWRKTADSFTQPPPDQQLRLADESRDDSVVTAETARLLGIKTSALYYKLEKYGIE
jgi:DNA-binding NtrC family response regulator